MFKTHNVVPLSSWGTLPSELRRKWEDLSCDVLVQPAVPVPNRVAILPGERIAVLNHPETKHPIIGIAVCTTTRKTGIKTLQDMALFTILLPSFVATAEPNFEYWVYVLIDAGDGVLDTAAMLKAMAIQFDNQVQRF